MNSKELIEKIEEFIEENKVTYDMGKTWCVILEDDEKSEPLLPFIRSLKEELNKKLEGLQ